MDLGGIADDVVVTAAPPRRLLTVHLDSAGLRLTRWGAALSHHGDEGWRLLLPLADPDAAPLELRYAGAAAAVPEAVVDLCAPFLRGAPLRVIARVRRRRQVLVLRTHAGDRLAEVDDEEVSVLDGRRLAARFRELGVNVDAAAPWLLDGILERLRNAGADAADATPALGHVLGERSAVAPEVAVDDLAAGADAAAAVRRAIAASVVRLVRHEPHVRLGDDPEAVHQARVATRRLRSDLRSFATLLEPAWAAQLGEALRELAAALGRVRDAEVLSERLRAGVASLPEEDRPGGGRLLARLDEEVATARAALLRELRAERHLELLERLVEAAAQPQLLPEATAPAAALLTPLAAAPWRRLRRAARVLVDPVDEELHALRIRAKRARYAAEAVAPVAGRRALAFARAAAALQEVLGEHHDAVVAAAWLRAAGSRGGSAYAAGQLAARERDLAAAAAARWPAAWRAARRRGRRAWS